MKEIVLILLLVNLLFSKSFEITPKTTEKLKEICKIVNPGDEIVLSGGVYTKPFPTITCSGSQKSDVVIRAKKNQKATIKQSWIVKANYLTIKGLNFVGNNNSLNYQKVIKQWWHPSKELRKIGLLIEGHHITL